MENVEKTSTLPIFHTSRYPWAVSEPPERLTGLGLASCCFAYWADQGYVVLMITTNSFLVYERESFGEV